MLKLNSIGNGHPILVTTLYVISFLNRKDMLAGNNFPEIFVHLAKELESRSLKDKLPALINKQNATGNTPLRTFLYNKRLCRHH